MQSSTIELAGLFKNVAPYFVMAILRRPDAQSGRSETGHRA
jgi:hypothetical protein